MSERVQGSLQYQEESLLDIAAWAPVMERGELQFRLCRRCHHGPVKRLFPKGHIFQATRTTPAAALHINKQHSINENGTIPPK
jgi:hypothetical protein